ncbi:MAG: hypothetical protein OEO83_17805 [Alphaproteobacteria bacterium]|nr:hypothetical protein [Alphaproteobacteria bacterium]
MALGLAVAAAACAMKAYDGADRPVAEVAVLERWSRHGGFPGIEAGSTAVQARPVRRYRHHTVVTAIDGRETGLARRIELRPGRHIALVDYARRPETLSCRLGACAPDYRNRALSVTVPAEAGRAYRIRVERRRGRDWWWVEDITLRDRPPAVVAGRKPPPKPGSLRLSR